MVTHLRYPIVVVVGPIAFGLVMALSVARLALATTAQNIWTSIGLEKKVITSLAVDPQRPTTLYAGSSSGVYKTVDGGGSWQPMITGLPGFEGLPDSEGFFAKALAIDSRNPNTIYMVGGKIEFAVRAGIFKSTNGGMSWRASDAGLEDYYVAILVIDPQRPSILYAGSTGANGGIFKSTNAGGSWRAMNTGLNPGDGGHAVAVDPRTPTTLYAGTWRGMFKSTDGGGSWHPIGTDLVDRRVAILAVDPQTPSTLYAGAWKGLSGAETPCGLFKSTDGGRRWRVINAGLGIPTVFYGVPTCDVTALAIDPKLPTNLYAGTGGGVFKSTDGGENWHAVNAGLGNLRVIVVTIDPRTPTTLYAGTSSGVFVLRQ